MVSYPFQKCTKQEVGLQITFLMLSELEILKMGLLIPKQLIGFRKFHFYFKSQRCSDSCSTL